MRFGDLPMQSNSSSETTEVTKRSSFWGSRLGVAAKRLVLGLAWLVIWLVTLGTSAELSHSFYLHQNEQEGFAATLGLMGVLLLGPLGFLLSILVARKSSRLWTLLIGAAVTGTGTVALILLAFTSPLDHFRADQGASADQGVSEADRAAIEGVIRSAARAPIEERAPDDRLLFIIGPGLKKGLIDTEGRIVVEPQYDWALSSSEGRAMVESRGLRGFVDGTGRVAIEPKWDEVSSFTEGLAVVATGIQWSSAGGLGRAQEGGKRGYIDRDGNVVIAPQFAEARRFSEGVAWVTGGVEHEAEERWGLIDRTGKYVIEPRFLDEPASFSEGLCPVLQGGDRGVGESGERFGYIDTNGMTVIQARFRLAGSFSEGLASIVEGEKLGFIDRAGRMSIPPRFDWGSVKRYGLPIFSEGLAAVSLGGRYGFVDKSDRVAIEPRYESAMDFRDGLAAVALQGKTGFIDKEGRMIIAPQFNRVESFEGGIARVEVKFGNWGYIRRDGAFLWHPLAVLGK